MAALLARHYGIWIVALTFLAAAFLSVVPLPGSLEYYRPEWMTLFLIYWVMALPHRVGLITAWLLGFFMDVLEGTLLGLNALALALVAYLVLSLYQRLRMFTLLQQSSTVLILVGLQQLISFWILTITDQNAPPNLMFMMSALTSALIWPFVFAMLRWLRRAVALS